MKERPLVPNLLKSDKFFMGSPCRHGHGSRRYKSGGRCVECEKIRNSALPRVLKKQQACELYRAENRKEIAAAKREYNLKNKDRIDSQYREKRTTTPWLDLLRGAKARSNKTGKEFVLTDEWALLNWTGCCALTGMPFDLSLKKNVAKPLSPSLDRIDNTLGYTPQNCRFILNCLNAFKQTMSDEEMLAIAKALLNDR